MESKNQIAVIGLGYVGLPLALEFAKKYTVVGFDINKHRIDELNTGIDCTLEIEEDRLKAFQKTNSPFTGIRFSDNESLLAVCNIYIITVPTPTGKNNLPNLKPLFNATETVARSLKKGDLVIYESTVYPGVTEEECAPRLEKFSGLKFNEDFFCGYSPERINPGDKLNTVSKILKITSGSTPEAAKKVEALYQSIVEAGTYSAPSIKVAEAAKLMENSQRDINIAFMNELAKIFNLLGIDTNAVLEAAGTKWNFLKFKPGLVGGHCIGAAPNYLAHKARQSGYHPEIILAGRKMNDSMGTYVAGETIKLMVKKQIPVKNAEVLILGFTFKENCPDIRNTRVMDIIDELKNYGTSLEIIDPWADPVHVKNEYGIETLKIIQEDKKYDAVILAVAHEAFKQLDIRRYVNPRSVIYDVKSILNMDLVDGRL